MQLMSVLRKSCFHVSTCMFMRWDQPPGQSFPLESISTKQARSGIQSSSVSSISLSILYGVNYQIMPSPYRRSLLQSCIFLGYVAYSFICSLLNYFSSFFYKHLVHSICAMKFESCRPFSFISSWVAPTPWSTEFLPLFLTEIRCDTPDLVQYLV